MKKLRSYDWGMLAWFVSFSVLGMTLAISLPGLAWYNRAMTYLAVLTIAFLGMLHMDGFWPDEG